MLIECGNHAAHRAIDDRPCVTTVHIPDADADGLGGYTHEPGLTVEAFREHWMDAQLNRAGITRLPGHEALLSIVTCWSAHGQEAPRWVKATPALHHELPQEILDKRAVAAADIESFLTEFYKCPGEKPADIEERYWTRYGEPGYYAPTLPSSEALFLNDGRVQQANNYGGGQVGDTGQATAVTATTLTTTKSYTLNEWTGYRVYASVSASQMVWGNVLSNTAGPNSVFTVDRWYAPGSPGGSAGSTPSATAAFLIADGGVLAGWFVGLTTTNITPGAADHVLSGEYTASGGGMVRKIAPYSLTSGTSPGSITLTPVFTANGSDTLPSTFYALGIFLSMVVGASGLMKYETSLTASQTVSASGDQLTCTDSQTFS